MRSQQSHVFAAALSALFMGAEPGSTPAHAGGPLWRDASSTLPAKTGRGHSMNAQSGDVDKDGDLDIVVAMEFEPNRLLINDGRGGFTDESSRLPRAAKDSEEVALADFDGDGDLDIAVGNEDDLVPELYLNDGAGRFTDSSERLRVRVKANAVIAFDADKDGDQDLFFGGDKVSVLFLNDGKGLFTDVSLTHLPPIAFANQDGAAGDIDGDGDIDLVTGNEDRNVILLNDGSGKFAPAAREALPRAASPEETRDVELLDADKDGDRDIFFANVTLWNARALAQNRLLLNDGKGRFTDVTAAWLVQRNESTLTAQPLDIDGDGRTDLLTAGFAGLLGENRPGPLRAFRNTGAKFEEVSGTVIPAGIAANGFDILTADFDGDGKADIFVASRGGPDKLLLTRPQ